MHYMSEYLFLPTTGCSGAFYLQRLDPFLCALTFKSPRFTQYASIINNWTLKPSLKFNKHPGRLTRSVAPISGAYHQPGFLSAWAEYQGVRATLCCARMQIDSRSILKPSQPRAIFNKHMAAAAQ